MKKALFVSFPFLVSVIHSSPVQQQSHNLSASIDGSAPTISTSSFSQSILDVIGKYLSSALIPLEPNSTRSTYRLGWQDGSDFPDYMGEQWAWGTTTLEVVKTSAIYLTRPAAFGPRITSEEGLQGTLIPISSFYRPPPLEESKMGSNSHQSKEATSSSSSSSKLILNDGLDNHGCPVEDGPGWKEEDPNSEEDDKTDSYLVGGDWDVDVSSIYYSESRSKYSSTFSKHSRQNYTIGKPPSDFIALVERGGNCSFVQKVRLSQSLGAIAVLVGGNDEGNGGDDRRPVTMFGKDSKDIEIPSSFVTRGSYLDLLRLIEEIKQENLEDSSISKEKESKEVGLEIILSRTDLDWEWPLIDLALLLLLLPSIMTILTLIIHRIKIIRQRRKDRAPKLSVLNLPCLIWRSDGKPWEKVDPNEEEEEDGDDEEVSRRDLESHGRDQDQDQDQVEGDGDGAGPSSNRRTEINHGKHLKSSIASTSSNLMNEPSNMTKASFGNECAICLEEFKDGDRIRLLPCGHIYHRVEIDDWLCRIKKLCPICKRDIMVPIPPAPPIQLQEASQEEQGETVVNDNTDESTPLLNNSSTST